MAKKSSDKQDEKGPRTARISNRRAFFDFAILEKLETGIQLTGTEVKSLRAGNASLDGAFGMLRDNQVYLVGANIAIYPQAKGSLQHDPMRDRKLLVHKRQIESIKAHVDQKGHTLVPLAIYFKAGWAKCELAAAAGKRAFDKRESIQKREQQRDMQRAKGRRDY